VEAFFIETAPSDFIIVRLKVVVAINDDESIQFLT